MNKKIIKFQGLSFKEELRGERIDFVNQPIYLSLIPWEDCNWRCRYCHQGGRQKRDDKLTLNEMKDLITEAVDLGIRSVLFMGGEVFLKNAWETSRQVVEAIYDAGLITVIYTNGSQIGRGMTEFLADHNVSIALKCDTLIPEKYDYLAGKNGAHDSFLKTLNVIKRTSIGDIVYENGSEKLVRLLLSTVGCALNMDEYTSIARFATEQNARWMMEGLNCHGNAASNMQELGVDPQEHVQSMKLALGLNPEQFFDGGVATSGCRLFSGITIRQGGEIAICPQDYNFLGNIREVDSLKMAWKLVQQKITQVKFRERWQFGCPVKKTIKEANY